MKLKIKLKHAELLMKKSSILKVYRMCNLKNIATDKIIKCHIIEVNIEASSLNEIRRHKLKELRKGNWEGSKGNVPRDQHLRCRNARENQP